MLLPEKNQTVTHIFCFALFVAALPWVFGLSRATSYYTDVMVFVAIHSIIAAGLSLLLGYAGQISLGQAAFYGLGAYASGILTTRLGLSPWLGIMAGMVLAAGPGLWGWAARAQAQGALSGHGDPGFRHDCVHCF